MSLDIHPEYQTRKPKLTLVGLFIWLGIVAAAVMVIAGLSGCAKPQKELVASVCYLRVMGTTEEGYTVVMQACQSPESFAESQQ